MLKPNPLSKDPAEALLGHIDTTSNLWYCRAGTQAIRRLVEAAINSNAGIVVERAEAHTLSPATRGSRPVFELVHRDGRRLALAPTGMSNIQVFSKKRRKSTHYECWDFGAKLKEFLWPGGPSAHEGG